VETPLWQRWRDVHRAHAALAERLAAEEEPEAWTGAGWDALVREMADAIDFHRRFEETVFFPRLARYFVGGGPVPLAVREHRQWAEAWDEIVALVGAGRRDAGRDRARALAAAVRLHLRKEDLTLLPVARARLSSRDWQKLQELADTFA
jgi:hemerythrin-like domain-containing protein